MDKPSFFEKLITAGSGTSSMRVIAITVVVNIMVVWSIVCLFKKDIVDIPFGVLSVLGLVVTGKVVQRFAEGTDQIQETKNDNAGKS